MGDPGNRGIHFGSWQLERDRLKELYELHAGSVVRYLYSLCGSHELALDLMQEVFLRAGLFQGVVTSEKGWLFQIAKNIFLNEMRSRSRKREVPLLDEMEGALVSKDRSDENLLRMEVVESLQKEGGRFFDVFLLRVEGDLSCAEIGKVLGVSERTIRRDLEKIGALVRRVGGIHD